MVTYLHLEERTVEVDLNIVEEIAANTTTDEISNAVSDVPERKPEEDAPPDRGLPAKKQKQKQKKQWKNVSPISAPQNLLLSSQFCLSFAVEYRRFLSPKIFLPLSTFVQLWCSSRFLHQPAFTFRRRYLFDICGRGMFLLLLH